MGFDEGVVTPEDIKRWVQDRIDAGGDREALQASFNAAMREAGGTLEKLASAWTWKNQRKDLWAAFREQLYGAPEESGDVELSETDKERLQRLIKENPELARDVLRKIPPHP